jgi:hypothetical protein
MPHPDNVLCPFCGQPNGCQAPDPGCWCNSEPVPAGLRALVPADQVMRSCICRSCVRSYKENPEGFASRAAATRGA